MTGPFFVVGTQRSGTTLLGRMLDAHPRLYCLNELAGAETPAPLWHAYEHLQAAPASAAALAGMLVQRLGLRAPYAAGSACTVLDHVDRALASKAREQGKARWGIKDPRLTYFLARFRARFPDAQFVFIVRDPRAVCSSYLRQRENVANVFHGARLWCEEVARQRAFADAHRASAYWLRYEDLVHAPERELRALMGFLGERYHEAQLRYHERRPDMVIHAGNIDVTRAVQVNLAARWRSRLTPGQIEVVEALAAAPMRALGYEPCGAGGSVGRLRRTAYAVHQWLLTNYWWQQRSGWHGLRRCVPGLARDADPWG